MPDLEQYRGRNNLLGSLPATAFKLLHPHLEPVLLERGDILIEADTPFDHVHFPNRGICSMVIGTPDSRRVEVGLFGREGMSGVGAVLGVRQMPQKTIVQVPGDGYRLEIGALRTALAASSELLEKLLLFIHTMVTQASYTALSNASQLIEERLARWLLMCHDRVEGDDIALTHEFLSIMLAVQRPSVTTALHVIEGHGIIRATRGNIRILDREALVDFADSAYGAPEAEYRRLIGNPV
jgi:CRP-like cAMP-binding protein